MYSYQRPIRAALLFNTALAFIACGGGEGTTPGSVSTAGTTPSAPVAMGSAGIPSTAGRQGAVTPGTAGVPGGAGIAGRGAPPVTSTGGVAAIGGRAATSGTGGAGTAAGSTAVAGTGGLNAAGMVATGGVSGSAGNSSAGMQAGNTAAAGSGMMGSGKCCMSGDCICRGEAPMELSSSMGPYRTSSMRASTGTVHFPMDAEPPFAGVAICPGFTNTGPEMTPWGQFYASWGIVTMVTNTSGSDQPAVRARKLLAAVAELKEMNMASSGPLSGKMSGRYGTSGYSMGGGGTTIASGDDSTLKTSIGLAAWGGQGSGVSVPTLLLCGSSDTTAPCSMSSGVYRGIPNSTPKMQVTISGATHFSWFGPTNAGRGESGKIALAFQKVFLEGDERWKPLLVGAMSNKQTNIQ